MSGTPMIHDLVSEGRATPEQGALLIEFRHELEVSRERKRLSGHPIARALMAIATFVIVLLGVRRASAG